MSWAVKQSARDILRFSVFRQDHGVGFLALYVAVQVDDLDADLEVVQQCHYLDLVGFLVDLLDLGLAEELHGDSLLDEGLVEDSVVLEFAGGEEAHHEDDVVGDGGVAEHVDDLVDFGDGWVVQLFEQQLEHVLEDHAFEACLDEVLLGALEFAQQPLLQSFVLADVEPLEDGEGECAVEAAAVSAGLPVVTIFLVQVLHLDVKAFVVDELVEHEGNGPQVADQGRLGLDLESDFLLLLVVQLQLLLVLRFLHHRDIQIIISIKFDSISNITTAHFRLWQVGQIAHQPWIVFGGVADGGVCCFIDRILVAQHSLWPRTRPQ